MAIKQEFVRAVHRTWTNFKSHIRYFPSNFAAVNRRLRQDAAAGAVLWKKSRGAIWLVAIELSVYFGIAITELVAGPFGTKTWLDVASSGIQGGLWFFVFSLSIDFWTVYFDAVSDLSNARVVSARDRLYKLVATYSEDIGIDNHKYVWSTHKISRLTGYLTGNIKTASGDTVCVDLASVCNNLVTVSDVSAQDWPNYYHNVSYISDELLELANIADMLSDVDDDQPGGARR